MRMRTGAFRRKKKKNDKRKGAKWQGSGVRRADDGGRDSPRKMFRAWMVGTSLVERGKLILCKCEVKLLLSVIIT